MSGRYNGLQAKVAAKNNLAAWIPCAGHSLNLVVKAAAGCCTAAVSLVLKRINTIRWSCRADASKTFVQGYPEIKNVLAEFADNPNEVPKVRSESNGLYMCLLETGIYSVFWNDILEKVNATSRKLQDPKLDLNAAVAMVVSLKRFVEVKRETITEYERLGATLSGTSDYVQTHQRPRNVRFGYGPASDAELTPQKFRVTSYMPVIDQFVVSLAHRLSAYEELCSRFGFLGKLESLSPVEIERSADNIVVVYKDDLEQCFGNELVQFVAFSNEFLKDANDNIGKEHFLYRLIIDKRVKCSFPNVEIALRMCLILMVTNCSGERSFSKLKYIKNRLRTTMANERVTHLSLLSIEYDILRETDFDDLITDLLNAKVEKCLVCRQ